MQHTIVDIQLKDGNENFKIIGTIARAIVSHRGWYSATYKGKRFQVHGGIRNPLFINVQHPLKGRAR